MTTNFQGCGFAYTITEKFTITEKEDFFYTGCCGFVDVVPYQLLAVSVSVMVDQVEERTFSGLSHYPIVPK